MCGIFFVAEGLKRLAIDGGTRRKNEELNSAFGNDVQKTLSIEDVISMIQPWVQNRFRDLNGTANVNNGGNVVLIQNAFDKLRVAEVSNKQ